MGLSSKYMREYYRRIEAQKNFGASSHQIEINTC